MVATIGFSQSRLKRDVIFGTRLTSYWFDRAHVLHRVDKVRARVLSRFGYFVMRDARQSIRRPRRKRVSELTDRQLAARERARREGKTYEMPPAPSDPGKPPRNLTGLLKYMIFFSYDRYSQGVVVGPALAPSGDAANPIPRILEEGGTANNIRWMKRPYRIAARPYMQPAFDRQLDRHMPDMWRNAIQ